MAKLFNLENKNVLLTGASKGMGMAMAQGLVNHGANVVISSRKLDQCEKAAKTINDSIDQEKAFPYSCNTSSKDELSALVDFSMTKLGSITTLVCNVCSRKATMVVRLDENGKVITEGSKVQIGGNDVYRVLCRKHFNEATKLLD